MQQPNDTLLNVLSREGVLINVSVRYWRGSKKLKAEDLGLNPDDVSDRLISLGHKRLLPKDALSAIALIEGRAQGIGFPSELYHLVIDFDPGVAEVNPSADESSMVTVRHHAS